jgi:hypothetical protein
MYSMGRDGFGFGHTPICDDDGHMAGSKWKFHYGIPGTCACHGKGYNRFLERIHCVCMYIYIIHWGKLNNDEGYAEN